MKRWLPWGLMLGRVIVGGLFVWAAFTKVSDFGGFAEEVANYQLLPARLVPLVAATLPGIELVAGVLLVLGVLPRASAAVIAGLLVVFMVGLSQALVRGIDLTCGCFGGADEATWGTVWRDVAMLVPVVGVLVWGPGRLVLRAARD